MRKLYYRKVQSIKERNRTHSQVIQPKILAFKHLGFIFVFKIFSHLIFI